MTPDRLAEIRASVAAAPHPAPGTWACFLRELIAEVDRLTKRVAELESAAESSRPADEDPIAYALTDKAARPAILSLPPSRATRRLQAEMRADVEDLHNGPLDHAYRLCRDLPAGGEAK